MRKEDLIIEIKDNQEENLDSTDNKDKDQMMIVNFNKQNIIRINILHQDSRSMKEENMKKDTKKKSQVSLCLHLMMLSKVQLKVKSSI